LSSFDWEEIQAQLDFVKGLLQESETLSQTLLNSTSDENAHYEIKHKVFRRFSHEFVNLKLFTGCKPFQTLS